MAIQWRQSDFRDKCRVDAERRQHQSNRHLFRDGVQHGRLHQQQSGLVDGLCHGSGQYDTSGPCQRPIRSGGCGCAWISIRRSSIHQPGELGFNRNEHRAFHVHGHQRGPVQPAILPFGFQSLSGRNDTVSIRRPKALGDGRSGAASFRLRRPRSLLKSSHNFIRRQRRFSCFVTKR